MKRLYTPFKVNQLELKNRVIMSPMSVGHTVDGFIMDDVVEFYRRRALGGVGLIIFANMQWDKVRYNPNHGAMLTDEKYIPSLKMLTDAILRANGANQRHRPDIVLGRKAFEVELNHKPLGILMKNIQANDSYGSQVWITPDSRPGIARNLLACAKKVGVEIKVIPLWAIEEQVSAANIHENSVCSESGTDIESVVSIPINSPVDKYAAYLDEL